MGADFLLTWVPCCTLTDTRRTEAHTLIDAADFSNEDEEFFWNLDLEKDNDPDVISQVKQLLKEALEAIFAPEAGIIFCSREAYTARTPGADYSLCFSGGMSWGDAPTGAFSWFGHVAAWDTLWSLLEAWARADAQQARQEALPGTRPVEFALLYEGGAWDTEHFDVPRALGEDSNALTDWLLKTLASQDRYHNVGCCCVYHIPPLEEEEPTDEDSPTHH
jgi:hypothetical protein